MLSRRWAVVTCFGEAFFREVRANRVSCGSSVKQRLHLDDRTAQCRAPAEAGRELDHVAPFAERLHFEDVGKFELGAAVFRIFLDDGIKDFTGL